MPRGLSEKTKNTRRRGLLVLVPKTKNTRRRGLLVLVPKTKNTRRRGLLVLVPKTKNTEHLRLKRISNGGRFTIAEKLTSRGGKT